MSRSKGKGNGRKKHGTMVTMMAMAAAANIPFKFYRRMVPQQFAGGSVSGGFPQSSRKGALKRKQRMAASVKMSRAHRRSKHEKRMARMARKA